MLCFSIIYSVYNRRHAAVPLPLVSLEQLSTRLQACNENYIGIAMEERRNRIIQAFEPHLTDFARELVRKEYRNILRKIVEARGIFK